MGDLIWIPELEKWISAIAGGSPVPPPPVSPPVSPPTQPHVVATPPGAVVGSMWVEGAELHYIDTGGVEYAETGASFGTPPGAVVGSISLSSPGFIHYIDSSGVDRTISRTAMTSAPVSPINGSIWVDSPAPAGREVQWIGASATRYQWWNGF